MPSLEDEVPPELTLTDEGSSVIPQEQAVDSRVDQTHFGLGQKSPGKDVIKTNILSGDEKGLRERVAYDEDLENERYKQDVIARMAKQKGGNLSRSDLNIVQSLSATDIRTDPVTVLEKKFADRYVNQILAAQDNFASEPVLEEASIASKAITEMRYYQHESENLESEWSKTGWGTWLANEAAQIIPFLPWWRQEQALKERPGHSWLLGNSVAENVQYMWALDPETRRAKYKQTIDTLKQTNPVDAVTFARAMAAFPASEQYLGNLMSIADFTSLGAFAGKTLGKLFGFGKKAVPAPRDPLKVVEDIAAGEAKVAEREASVTPKQLDLFGEQPEQGSFRFMNEPGMAGPPEAADFVNANGGIRRPDTGKFTKASVRDSLHPNGVSIPHTSPEAEVSPTGQFRGSGGRFNRSTEAMKQTEMDLAKAEHQSDLFGATGGKASTEAQKYAEAMAQTVREAKVALADAVKAVSGPKLEPEAVLSATGNTSSAGFLGAVKRLLNPVSNQGLEGVAAEIPTFANPVKFFDSSKTLGREQGQRLAAKMAEQADIMLAGFRDAARPVRLTPEALAVAKKEAERALSKEYTPRINNGVLDFEYIPSELHPANVDTLVGWVGRNDANVFKSEAEAGTWAKDVYKLGDNEYIIRQQGTGYKIGVFKHLDETTQDVTKALDGIGNRTSGGIINMLLDRLTGGVGLRSADDLLSKFQNEQRIVATHAPQQVRRVLKDIIDKDIYKALSGKELREVEDILRINRDMPSVKYPGERGRWYDTAAELEQAFLEKHKHLPSSEQIVAYDTFKRVSDFDWLLRNVSSYRDKARLGVETFRFTFHNDGAAAKTPHFEGKQLDGIPWELPKTDQDAGIWIYNSNARKGEFKYKYDMTPDERKALDKMVSDEGYRVVQVFDPKTHPLKGIAQGAQAPISDQINFIVANTWEKAPLTWKQVEYRPGGHVIYDHPWYISQPVIREGRSGKLTYFGDNNVLNAMTQAEAVKWAERLDTMRQLLKAGKTDAAEAYRKANLPHTAEQINHLFFDNNAPLSLDHRITIKEAGRNTLDTDLELKKLYKEGGIADSTKNIYDLSNFMDKSFLAERDNIIQTVKENGGLYRLENAEQLDPYLALNRAMAQGMRNIWMNEYKIGAAESFLSEFKDILKPTQKQLAAHPIYWLYHPQWEEGVANQSRLAAAKANQRAVVQFLGAKSELSASMDHIGAKLMSSVYHVAGQKGVNAVNAVGKFTDSLGLASVKDPVSFMRAVAFHSKLGLFSPVQLFVQMQTMSHILGVAGPVHALPGMAAGVFARYIAHNPEMTEAFAKKAAAFGWKPADFKEMVESMKSSGIFQVAGEAVLRDDVMDPRLFRSATGNFLDKGAFFFNEGERHVRLAGFATAFREFKAANPGKAVGQRELASIMDRSDLLTANMTRKSAAGWQTGVLAVPTQFFAFNARMMEQMLGKRLTPVEKIRALATHSALYGVPVATGILTMGTSPLASFGVPSSYEDIKEEAIKRGYDMNNKYFEAFAEGGLSLLLNWVTGKEYNVASRYGPGASTAVSNMIRDDKSLHEILFGASGTILGDMIKTTYPFQHAAASIFSDNGDYPVKASDWMNLFRNAAVVDTGAKIHGILAYGKWITKTGTQVAPAENMDAVMALMGLSPQVVAETYLKINAIKGFESGQAPLEKDAIHNFRMAIQAGSVQDYNGMKEYMTRAKTSMLAADMTYEKQVQAFNAAVKQSGELSSKIDWSVVNKLGLKHQPDRLQNFLNQKK
jgi:hypothetical protein